MEIWGKGCWSHCWSTLSCWVGPPFWVGNCRVITPCRVGTPCRVVILCQVDNNCRVVIPCRACHHCRVCRSCRVVTCSWVGNLCRARHTCRVVLWSWTRWRLDDSDGSSLWLIRNGRGQINLSSGHMSQPRMVRRVFLMMYVMMLLGQGPVVDHSTRWRGQGPVVNRSPLMMMMMRRGRPRIRSLVRNTCWSRMGLRIDTMLGPGAGPSRRGRRSSPLPTLMVPGRVTCPGWLMPSRKSTMVISVTTLITVWTVAIWSPSPGRAVGPWESIYHRHTGWNNLAGILFMRSGRPGIRIALHALDR